MNYLCLFEFLPFNNAKIEGFSYLNSPNLRVVLRVRGVNEEDAKSQIFPHITYTPVGMVLREPEIQYLLEQTGNESLNRWTTGEFTHIQPEYPWPAPEGYRLYTVRHWDYRLPPLPEAFLFETEGKVLWGIHLEDTVDALIEFIQQHRNKIQAATVPNSPGSMHLWISENGIFDA